MIKTPISMILAISYLLFCTIIIASELYTRIYDTGNSEMAGLASYLFTMPSSLLVDRLSESVFGIKVGASTISFVFVLGISAILNALLLYLVLHLILSLTQRQL